jgi:hypothetical protein
MTSRISLHRTQRSEYRLLCSPLSSWISMTGGSYQRRLHNCNEQLPAFRRSGWSEYGDVLPKDATLHKTESSPSLYRCDKHNGRITSASATGSYPEPIKSKPCFSHQAVSVTSGACDDLHVPVSLLVMYLFLLLFPCAAGQLSLPIQWSNWTASIQAFFVMQF